MRYWPLALSPVQAAASFTVVVLGSSAGSLSRKGVFELPEASGDEAAPGWTTWADPAVIAASAGRPPVHRPTALMPSPATQIIVTAVAPMRPSVRTR